MPNGLITTLTRANKNSESLRTTVPASIIKQFDLKNGDKLVWRLEVNKKSIVIKLHPMKERILRVDKKTN